MTAPNLNPDSDLPDYSANQYGLESMAQMTEGDWKGMLEAGWDDKYGPIGDVFGAIKELVNAVVAAFQGDFGPLGDLVEGALVEFADALQLDNLVDAIRAAVTGGSLPGGNPLGDFFDDVFSLFTKADNAQQNANNAIALANTAQNAVTDLSAIVAASRATQAWVGNINDMASVPRVMLTPAYYGGSHNHGAGTLGASTTSGNVTGTTSSTSLGGSIPRFTPDVSKITPANGAIYYTPIVSDREGNLDKFRFITGSDNSLFPIQAYYVALMILNPATNTLQTVWNPGDIQNSMGSSLSEVSISMGLVGAAAKVSPQQILVAAHQQIAPGLAQTPRSVAWVPQAGVARTSDVLLRGCYYKTSGTVSAGIPSTTALSSLVAMNDGIPWYAVSVNN